MSKQQIYTVIKWLFAIAAYGYLAYKLVSFDNYDEMLAAWKQIPASKYGWLAATLVLLPLNLLLEARKWIKLTKSIIDISVPSALKTVLSGICSGFFTPNRIGEVIGRISYLPASCHAQGLTLSIVNSITQNLTILLCGIPASIVFFLYIYTDAVTSSISVYIIVLGICLLLFCGLYLRLPRLFKQNKFTKIKRFTDCLTTYSTVDLLKIMLISLTRYAVFCVQFFCVLCFFGVEITVWQAVVAIPVNYLFVTFTPSFAFSEVAVRSSYAVLFIGVFSPHAVSIILAGTLIWVINTVIPMLVGAIYLVKYREIASKVFKPK